MSTKMKGLLKGLRYIQQIFDNEKEEEIEIGYPTDVKHVAHIGWDGPSKNDVKSTSEAAPAATAADQQRDSELKDGQAHSQPLRTDLPKPSKRQPTNGTSEQSDAQRRGRRHHSSHSTGGSLHKDAAGKSKPRQPREGSIDGESLPANLPDIPKKHRQKKTKEPPKEGGGSGSGRSRGRSQSSTDPTCGAEPKIQSNECSAAGLEAVGGEETKCNEA